MINWQADEAIATIVSSIAIVAGAIFVVIQLRQAARDRYFTITANLFEILAKLPVSERPTISVAQAERRELG